MQQDIMLTNLRRLYTPNSLFLFSKEEQKYLSNIKIMIGILLVF